MRDGSNRVGFLSNVKTITIKDGNDEDHAAVLCYFYDEEGEWFKTYVKFQPYFYIKVDEEWISEVMTFLGKIYERIAAMSVVEKIDLDDVKHMSGVKSKYIKLSFSTILVRI